MMSTLQFQGPIPLSLYIHFPWCVQKCPYCDFNSHTLKTDLPESVYIDALIADLEAALPQIWGRPIISIFMGGGTPSLFSAESIARLLSAVKARLNYAPGIEITLEANPGTVEQKRFAGYFEAGVNRISLGVQSFDAGQLKRLGRIHDTTQAHRAIASIKQAGFTRYNIDLMYALPHQTIAEAIEDLETALSYAPPHLSWYQLTLEPNTPFYHHPPAVPSVDLTADIEQAGLACLQSAGLKRYEISAYHQSEACHHNINYWQFGDYLGIGAGAHSKITDVAAGQVTRYTRYKHPKTYLTESQRIQTAQQLSITEIPFEYMLNALRLIDGVPLADFTAYTGLPYNRIEATLAQAVKKGWLNLEHDTLQTTNLGQRFLNDVMSLFLTD